MLLPGGHVVRALGVSCSCCSTQHEGQVQRLQEFGIVLAPCLAWFLALRLASCLACRLASCRLYAWHGAWHGALQNKAEWTNENDKRERHSRRTAGAMPFPSQSNDVWTLTLIFCGRYPSSPLVPSFYNISRPHRERALTSVHSCHFIGFAKAYFSLPLSYLVTLPPASLNPA